MLVGSGSAPVTEPRRGGCWWVAGDRAELEASPVLRSPPLDFILGHGGGVARDGGPRAVAGGSLGNRGHLLPLSPDPTILGLSQDPGRLLPRLKNPAASVAPGAVCRPRVTAP